LSLVTKQYVSQVRLKREETFLVGESGSGKSTLLEAIAVAWGFNPEGGTKNFNFGTRISHSPLEEYLRLVKGIRRPKDGFFLRAESFFNVAYPDATICCSAEGVSKVDYFETEHYRVRHDFLKNPKRMLDVLLDPK
jgi:predicted ATPase